MMMTGSSFWVSDMGPLSPSPSKIYEMKFNSYESNKALGSINDSNKSIPDKMNSKQDKLILEERSKNEKKTKADEKPNSKEKEKSIEKEKSNIKEAPAIEEESPELGKNKKKRSHFQKKEPNSKASEQFYQVIVDATESSKNSNGGSGDNFGKEKDQSLLAPGNNKDDLTSQVSLYSQVSNPFNIKIIEDNETENYINNTKNPISEDIQSKDSSSNPKRASEKAEGNVSEKDEIKNDEKAKENTEKKKMKIKLNSETKIKKRIEEKAEKKAENDKENAEKTTEEKDAENLEYKSKNAPKNENVVPSNISTNEEDHSESNLKSKKKKAKNKPINPSEEPNITPLAEEAKYVPPKRIEPVSKEEPQEEEKQIEKLKIEPKEDIKLHGLTAVAKPVDLDKLLLSDQTNGILKKIKKKRKVKRVKKKISAADVNQTMQPLKDDNITNEEKNGESTKHSEEKTQLNEEILDKKPGSGKTECTVLNGSVNSATKEKLGGLLTDPKSLTKVRLKNIKTLKEMSGKKNLGELKSARLSNGTPKRTLNNTSIMNGGDVDVNTYIKNIKQIEQEKNQFKRQLMSGSNSSNASKKQSKSALNRYT
jgi:hypothetical protein